MGGESCAREIMVKHPRKGRGQGIYPYKWLLRFGATIFLSNNCFKPNDELFVKFHP